LSTQFPGKGRSLGERERLRRIHELLSLNGSMLQAEVYRMLRYTIFSNVIVTLPEYVAHSSRHILIPS
jgi:hypothetical protein